MTEAERFDRICSIFESVRELNGAELASKLEKLCANDDGIRAEVEEMLGVHASASPLDQSSEALLDRLVGAPAIDRKPEIDRYEIGERIGEGGMGVVYGAQMRNPSRSVAIKVIRLGMDSERVIARFELERRALARMEHPNIASVLDAGVTSDGRPYFAMELVRGESIVNYCDAHAKGTGARLRLFIQVCHAIQHAHQKGIIHRDIKPSNVIVAEHDGVEVPKVIDFGIAKATQGDMMPETTMTMHSHAIGTPAYMSPEQADQTLGDVDTRTDVYSLGVLLYEMLTGSTPLTREELTGKSYREMIECIRDKEPPRPSVRVSTWAKTGESELGRVPSIEPGRLSGDLDWIVMKCLEKDPSRRYNTVGSLSEDLVRHLRNEPVLARPASRVYIAQKFVRRHRGQVVAVTALLLVLVFGVIGTTIGMVWALDERAKAEKLAESEYAAQLEATAAAERAVLEAETAEDLSRFFIMDVLSAADPSRTTDRELTVRQALVNASENIEGKFEDRPDVESRIHNALGFLFGQLGSPELAERHHIREWEIAEEENGELSIDAARMMHSVVGSLARQGRDSEAIELTRRQLRVIEQLGTPEAEMLKPRAVGNLGALLVRTGRNSEAAPILEETLVLKREIYGDRHPTTLSTLNNLSSVLVDIGELDRAIILAAEAHNGRIEVLGEGDPRTFVSLLNYASALTESERFDESLPMLEDGVSRAQDRLGKDHPTSMDIANSYARALLEHGDYEASEGIARDIVCESTQADPEMIQTRTHTAHTILASSLNNQSKHDEALQYTSELITALRSSERTNHFLMHEYLRIHGQTLTALNHFEEAESVLLEAWDLANVDGYETQTPIALLGVIVHLYQSWLRVEPSEETDEKLRRWSQHE
jgi:hypothetical protein